MTQIVPMCHRLLTLRRRNKPPPRGRREKGQNAWLAVCWSGCKKNTESETRLKEKELELRAKELELREMELKSRQQSYLV